MSQEMRQKKRERFLIDKYNTFLSECKFLNKESPMMGEIN
jgi:hypothetical protein